MWRPAVGFPLYEVSSLGRIKNVKTGRMLRPRGKKNGYLQVRLNAVSVTVHLLSLRLSLVLARRASKPLT